MPGKKRTAKTKRSPAAKKQVTTPKSGGKEPKPKAAAAKPIGKPKKPATPPKASALGTTFTPASVTAPTIVPQEPCLPLPQAVELVRSCSKVPPDLPLNTPLGQIFPSATARNAFCQCVADGVPIDRSKIPCAATNTLQDVIDAIAC
jgi:hypothetical protein